MKEHDLAALFTDHSRFPMGSVISVEPRYGIEPGQPDKLILLGDQFTPLELKVKQDIVGSLRPAQRRWTILALRAGVTCLAATMWSKHAVKICALGLLTRRQGSIQNFTILIEAREELVPVEAFNLEFIKSCNFVRAL